MKRTVLHIEDHEGSAKDMASLLRRNEFDVRTASSGSEGIEVACKWRPELILLDQNLPDIKGVEILIHLRRLGIETKVVMLTGYCSVENIVEYIKAGACDIIPKPAEIGKVINTLNRALHLGTALNTTVSNPPPIYEHLMNPNAALIARETAIEERERTALNKISKRESEVSERERKVHAFKEKEQEISEREERLIAKERMSSTRLLITRTIILNLSLCVGLGLYAVTGMQWWCLLITIAATYLLVLIPIESLKHIRGKGAGTEFEMDVHHW